MRKKRLALGNEYFTLSSSSSRRRLKRRYIYMRELNYREAETVLTDVYLTLIRFYAYCIYVWFVWAIQY